MLRTDRQTNGLENTTHVTDIVGMMGNYRNAYVKWPILL